MFFLRCHFLWLTHFPCSSNFGSPNGNRTRVTAVKGRCANRCTIGPPGNSITTLRCGSSRLLQSRSLAQPILGRCSLWMDLCLTSALPLPAQSPPAPALALSVCSCSFAPSALVATLLVTFPAPPGDRAPRSVHCYYTPFAAEHLMPRNHLTSLRQAPRVAPRAP